MSEQSNLKRHQHCPMRTHVGNCLIIGGSCTSIREELCDALHKSFKMATRCGISKQYACFIGKLQKYDSFAAGQSKSEDRTMSREICGTCRWIGHDYDTDDWECRNEDSEKYRWRVDWFDTCECFDREVRNGRKNEDR